MILKNDLKKGGWGKMAKTLHRKVPMILKNDLKNMNRKSKKGNHNNIRKIRKENRRKMFVCTQVEKLPSVEWVREKGNNIPSPALQKSYLQGVEDTLEAIKKDSRQLLEKRKAVPVMVGINGYLARNEEELGYVLEMGRIIQEFAKEEIPFYSSAADDKDLQQESKGYI